MKVADLIRNLDELNDGMNVLFVHEDGNRIAYLEPDFEPFGVEIEGDTVFVSTSQIEVER